MAEQCDHEPIGGSYNTWPTLSGHEYAKCRFCNAIYDLAQKKKVLRAKSAYQRSVDYFVNNNISRHLTEEDVKMYPLVPNKMREHYKKWQSECPCSECSLKTHAQ